MVFIILILNKKSSWGLVFAQEFLEEGEGCAGQLGRARFSSWKLTWSYLVTGQDPEALVFCRK